MKANPQLALARDFLEYTGTNIFLTGRAGTGKTTFLRNLRESSPKRMIVVAPTGVAAINAGGVTMHSFFQLPFGVFIPGTTRTMAGDGGNEIRRFSKTKIAIIKSLDLLVIDEISMVRADLLDSVDEVLRRFRDRSKPFGGVQLLMIGDLQQLAPVVKDDDWALLRNYYKSPYFFDSAALQKTVYTTVELRHIYRQTDAGFIELLARVRDNTIDAQVLEAINSRHISDFDPDQSEGYITLTSHNNTARSINDRKLETLSSQSYSFKASVDGQFPDYLYPVDECLVLKKGAQVMFCKNDPSPEKRFVNGTIGVVTSLRKDYIEVLPNGSQDPIEVVVAQWENSKYTIDPESKQIIEQIEGMYTQYPLKTAWAITIHKSQGLTFDRTIIDAADSFSHGQVYVALSRCRTLEGIVLRTPLGRGAIISDRTVGEFTRIIEGNQPTERDLDVFKQQYYEELLSQLFDFRPLFSHITALLRFMQENLWRLYPKLTQRWNEVQKGYGTEVLEVGLKFRLQINRLMSENYSCDPILAERISKGATYFFEKCTALVVPMQEALKAEVDNKELRKSYLELLTRMGSELRIKLSTLTTAQQSFNIKSYLEARAMAIAETETSPKAKFKPPKQDKQHSKESSGEDITNPELFAILRLWRGELAKEKKVPAYVIATTRTLIGIADSVPANLRELLAVKGIGKVFIEKYGDTVIDIIKDYTSGRLGEN